MSNNWLISLNQTLKRLKTDKSLRVAVMGIGHELRGDDAAGEMMARLLRPTLARLQNVLILCGGYAPENQTGVVRRFAPDLVLLVDAAEMGQIAGAVRWLSLQEISGISSSTHALPLDIIAQYLQAETGCEVALIGVQPVKMDLGAPLSPAVKRSVDEMVRSLEVTLRSLGILPDVE